MSRVYLVTVILALPFTTWGAAKLVKVAWPGGPTVGLAAVTAFAAVTAASVWPLALIWRVISWLATTATEDLK